MTRMDVIANADNAYWNYIAVLAKVDMTRAYLSQIDTVYAQTKTSYEVGMITQTDLVRIDARRSQIIYQLNQAESGLIFAVSPCATYSVSVPTPRSSLLIKTFRSLSPAIFLPISPIVRN